VAKTQPTVTVRQVIAGPGRGQWATVCAHPGCEGRTVTVDLVRELAEESARAHDELHLQDATP
jgi:hypothetical protein